MVINIAVLSFIQFIVEAAHGQVVHSWIDHPKVGVVHSRGDFKHEGMMIDHDIDPHDNPAKGRFVVNHDKKSVLLHQYPGSGKIHHEFLGSHLRHELKTPRNYSFRGVNADGKPIN